MRSDGRAAPIVIDGVFLEAKEYLAGYQIVDVNTEQRAIEIAQAFLVTEVTMAQRISRAKYLVADAGVPCSPGR